MNITDFKRIVTSFADRPTDLELQKGQLLTEIRGELIQANVILRDGILFVREKDIEDTAVSWIKNRIAGLPQLADRILDFVPSEPGFVDPCSLLLDELEYDPEEREQNVQSTTTKLVEILTRKIPGTTSVIYLTSDAGDGKTTLINTVAYLQAKRYKEKTTDWLLLPIPLGGGPFLRLDDIVIASIMNRLRFRYFYYDSFIELVRLGMIVPALDGFEEMFMQNSAGEALSATGNLMNKLSSEGSILIAARKAYFDYKSFGSQARLFDSITSSVSFAKMTLQRWDRDQFIDYTTFKGITNAEEIYDLVANKLKTPTHPILTRPVLIKQLLEVFSNLDNVKGLIARLESAASYFPAFVDVIIEREANYKWVDTSGEPYKPILSIEQHYELLSLLAEEMWLSNSDTLKEGVLDLIAEFFSDQNKLGIQTTRQVKERVKQHALIVVSEPNTLTYKFDHDEFRQFFLGVALAKKIQERRVLETKEILKKLQLPSQTFDSLVSRLRTSKIKLEQLKSTLDDIIKGEGQTSFVRENVGSILIRLLDNIPGKGFLIRNYEFSSNSFLTMNLHGLLFEECHFQNTSLEDSQIENSIFNKCTFDRIELSDSVVFNNVRLIDCEIACLYDASKDKGYYDDFSIKRFLSGRRISVEEGQLTLDKNSEFVVEDEDMELTERALRKFIRSNIPINDSILRLRLGSKADYFLKEILPDLLDHDILVEVDYSGSGQKRRFKLGVSFSQVDRALAGSRGNYKTFLQQFAKK